MEIYDTIEILHRVNEYCLENGIISEGESYCLTELENNMVKERNTIDVDSIENYCDNCSASLDCGLIGKFPIGKCPGWMPNNTDV